MYIYFWYISFIYVGQAASKQFSGQAAASCGSLADFVCVLCFCQLHMWPVEGRRAWHFRCSLCFMYILCVCECAREEKGKAALAAAICSPVTKMLCPKTLSSVNIYGAIAVQSPSPLSPSLAVVFPCVDTRQRKLSTKFVPRAAWHAATIDNNNKSNKRKII